MHDTAHEIGKIFFECYWGENYGRILDLGAANYNGSLRDFCPPGAEYLGIDLGAGPGVDLVIDDPARLPFEDDSFDVIVSSSCFEHDPMFWVTFLELGRVLKPGGVMYINAPSNGAVHRFPLDCWRFYPDAAAGLVQWAAKNGLDVTFMESFICGRQADVWNDCVMIFGKGEVEVRHLYLKMPMAVRNICLAGGVTLSGTWETEDMVLLRETRDQLKAADANCQRMIGGLALSRAPASPATCAVCASREFTDRSEGLDPHLIADWQLDAAEAAYIGRQQGKVCTQCGSNLRSQVLARSIAAFFGSLHPLQALAEAPSPQGRILEINEAGDLSPVLRRFPNHLLGAYPEIDLMSLPYDDNAFDIVIHSNSLEHVPDPIRALEECRRVLKQGGACIYTVPIVAGRLSRSRAGLPEYRHGMAPRQLENCAVHTEFGSDAWTYAAKAGFGRVTMDSLEYPAAIAITAWKDVT
jgi:SAM-dependent methyltransferase